MKADVRAYLKGIGKKGGAAKVAKGTSVLSPTERTRRAKEAAEARWGKKKPGSKKAASKKGKGL